MLLPRLSGICLFALAAAFAAEPPAPPPPEQQFKTLDPNVKTRCLPLLKNHGMGGVKAFFLVPADSTLGHVREIVQRADIEPEYLAVGKSAAERDGLVAADLAALSAKLQTAQPKALVTLGIQWHAGLKAPRINELLDKVRGGMGAVVEVRDLKEEPELAAALAQGKELDAPPLSVVAVDVPAVRRFELGKGRVAVVLCNWSNLRDAGNAALGDWTTLRLAKGTASMDDLHWRGFEYSYAWLADLIRWAGAQDASMAVTGAELKGDTLLVGVRNSGTQKAWAIPLVTVRSPRGEARTTGEGRGEILPGNGQVQVPLAAPLDSGPMVAEINLRSDDGRMRAFGTVGIVADAGATLKIAVEPRYQPAEKPGKCTIELAGTVAGGKLEVVVADCFGRVLVRNRQAIQLENGKAKVEVPLDSFVPLAVYHEAVARLYTADDDEQLLAEASCDFFLLPAKPPYADGFVFGVAASPEREPLMAPALAAVRELGIALHTHSRDDRVLYASGGWKAGTCVLGSALVLAPDGMQAAKAEWQKRARALYDTGARFVALGDARSLDDGYGRSGPTLAAFREWLRKRYSDVAALNQAWGAKFNDFADAAPKTRKELGDSPTLAPWLEFRMFIGEALGEQCMKTPANWAAEISPDLAVGEWSLAEPSEAWPVDWSRYAKCYRRAARAGTSDGVLPDLFRSFAPESRLGIWLTGGVPDLDGAGRVAPMLALLNGGSFCWLPAMSDDGLHYNAVLTSDQRPNAALAEFAKEDIPNLTGGIDRLLAACTPLHDGIAIGYSYPSWLADPDALARGAKTVAEELGFQHLYVTMDDVAAGRLEKDGFKVLILQAASCLSKEQVDGVKRFVEAGGLFFCVGRSGWRDTHGSPYADGSLLDALTGVDTGKAVPLGKTMATPAGEPALTVTVAHGGVQAKDATVLASVAADGKPLPIWTTRDLGKGKVYWLNAVLAPPAADTPEAVRKSQWDVLDHVLAMASIRPRLRLFQDNEPLFGGRTWAFETPSKRTLVLARYVPRKAEGVLVRFPYKAAAYDLCAHRHFGEVDGVGENFTGPRVAIYALSDQRVYQVIAKAEEEKVMPGGTVRVRIGFKTTDKEAKPLDLRPLLVTAHDPGNQEMPGYRRVILAGGDPVSAEVPLALNAAPGRSSVRVFDVFTGQEARAWFVVPKPEAPKPKPKPKPKAKGK